MPMFKDYKANRSHSIVRPSFWYGQKWMPTLEHMKKVNLTTRLTGLLNTLSNKKFVYLVVWIRQRFRCINLCFTDPILYSVFTV